MSVRSALLLPLAAVLAGCPATWAFSGDVYASKDPSAPPTAFDVSGRAVAGGELVPVEGVVVTCTGCAEPVTFDGKGHFFVSLGDHYAPPPPIALHVTAPGFRPVDIDAARAGTLSEAGYTRLVIVLRRE